MAQALARYDEFAEWYEQWIGDAPPLIAAHSGLLPAVTGDRVLDIACGQGRMSRYLARPGADVVGVDISAAMLGKARAIGPEDITYVRADVARHPAWWDRRPFDGCTCDLALMDIDDLAGTLSTVTTVLRQGGWFVASIVHPCFPGSERGRSSWPPEEGYEREGWWTSPDHNPDGVRIRVGATHRKLSTFLNALLDAGLEAERFVEPPAPVPMYLLWRSRPGRSYGGAAVSCEPGHLAARGRGSLGPRSRAASALRMSRREMLGERQVAAPLMAQRAAHGTLRPAHRRFQPGQGVGVQFAGLRLSGKPQRPSQCHFGQKTPVLAFALIAPAASRPGQHCAVRRQRGRQVAPCGHTSTVGQRFLRLVLRDDQKKRRGTSSPALAG